MEEGEVDLRDTYKEQRGTYGNVAVPNRYSSISEAKSASVTSAAPHFAPLSARTNNLQLERSVYALLSFPDKLSSQEQSRFCTEHISSQSPSPPGNQRQASSAAKKPQGLSPLKQDHASPSGQAAALLHASLLVKQYSSPPKLSAAANQSSSLKPSQAYSPPQPSSPFCSPIKPVEVSFQIKKLEASSPQSKQCQLSATAHNTLEASSPFKASSPQAKQPQASSQLKKLQASSPQSKQCQLSPPAENHFEASLPFKASSPQAKQPQASSPAGNNPYLSVELCAPQAPLFASAKQLLEGLPPAQISSPSKHDHQATYLPNLSHPVGSVSEKKSKVYLGLSSVQLSPQISPEKHGKRAFITRVNGKKRPRSSAVRDYPEGCGKNVSAKAIKVQAEQEKYNICYDKVGFKTQAAKDCNLPDHVPTPSTRQVRKEQKLVSHKEANPHRPLRMMEDMAALCLYKSLQTSVPLPKTQKVRFSLKWKQDAIAPIDPSLHKAQKKLKVRHISRILSPAEEDLSPNTSNEWKIQTNWLRDTGYEHATSAERLMKSEGGISHKGFSGGVMYAKKAPKHSEDLGKLLATEANIRASARSLVKKTLQEFDLVRRSLAIRKDSGHQRPDLTAAKILNAKGRWRNCHSEKIVGEVPGVEVGDQFSFRIEMLIIGLHRQTQGGIDFITGSVRPEGPLATSIVASGGYEDDDDCGDTFIYTGQGGNNYKGDRRQACDQVLTRGNLALSNSCKEKSPVRVIRGSTDDKFYTYDGLYDVVDCWFQTGAAGFGVYQFKLSRRPGQPELYSSIVRFVGSIKKKGLPRAHLLMGDISQGKETLPICVVNEVDEEAAPKYFTYIPKMKYPSWYSPDISKGCGCVGGCVDASKCLCVAKNGGEFPYNELGQIIIVKKVVFECGKSCACSSSCLNRVSQRGANHQLEVFKTRKRGWGVRSLETIMPGDLICEYVGELLSDSDAEKRIERDEYLFDIGNNTNTWSNVADLMDSTMEKAIVPIVEEKAIVPVVEDAGYAIDARLYGNVARFINHSCSPNLFAQDVVYDSDDLRFPHVILFSMENIPPMRELSYDYNYTIGHVRDANGNVKSKACYCGAQDCRGRLY